MVRIKDIAKEAGVSPTTVSMSFTEIQKKFPKPILIRSRRFWKKTSTFQV